MKELSGVVHPGENHSIIEVATTLEREMAKVPDMLGQTKEPTACPVSWGMSHYTI